VGGVRGEDSEKEVTKQIRRCCTCSIHGLNFLVKNTTVHSIIKFGFM